MPPPSITYTVTLAGRAELTTRREPAEGVEEAKRTDPHRKDRRDDRTPQSASSVLTFAASASIANGFVTSDMLGASWPLPITAFSA